MSAIRFVVRDGTGNLQRGTVLEDGDTATLNIGSSQDISLNLRRSEVASFDRQGSDLVVTLTDGSVLTLGGYFVEAGAVSNQLFLSDDGFLTEVQISEQGGDLISAYYSEAEAFGKWSADDALFFTRGDNVDFAIADAIVTEPEAGMLGTALLTGLGGIGATGAGAAVAGGAALLVGGGGGGGGDNTPPEASITAGTVSVGHTVNAVIMATALMFPALVSLVQRFRLRLTATRARQLWLRTAHGPSHMRKVFWRAVNIRFQFPSWLRMKQVTLQLQRTPFILTSWRTSRLRLKQLSKMVS